MSTYRELVYMVIDELKIPSDDSYFTEEHIVFLLNKFRAFFLKKQYSSVKKQVPDSAYQTLCLDLITVPAVPAMPCESGMIVRSREKIPAIMPIGNPSVYPIDYYSGDIAFIPRERMRYVGHNAYLKNIIYSSIGPDSYLYFKSANPQFLYLSKCRFTAVFEDATKAAELGCDEFCDVMDSEFPLEDSFVMPVIELIIQELRGPVYSAEDKINNASDDKSEEHANQVPQNQNLNQQSTEVDENEQR